MRMEPANEVRGERDSMGGMILPDHQAHRPYRMLRRHRALGLSCAPNAGNASQVSS
jgi:hypothetical protein